jgi:hypothetical protein
MCHHKNAMNIKTKSPIKQQTGSQTATSAELVGCVGTPTLEMCIKSTRFLAARSYSFGSITFA